MLNTLTKEYEKITITCTAPSKSFNLAGLQISNIIIPNGEIRKKIKKEISKVGYSQVGIMGIIAVRRRTRRGRVVRRIKKIYIFKLRLS